MKCPLSEDWDKTDLEGRACEMNGHGFQNHSHTSSQTMRKFYKIASLGMG